MNTLLPVIFHFIEASTWDELYIKQ